MIAYVDSSVLLRLLLNQAGKFKRFSSIEYPVSSRLLKAECLRTLDRARCSGFITEDKHIKSVSELYTVLEYFEFIDISQPVLERVGSSFGVALGTLDAIHLSSAILWQESTQKTSVFLTHDAMLAKAAIMSGFKLLE